MASEVAVDSPDAWEAPNGVATSSISSDPLQMKLQLENELREAENKLESRTRKLQERLRQVSQLQSSLKTPKYSPPAPASNHQEIHHHHYPLDAPAVEADPEAAPAAPPSPRNDVPHSSEFDMSRQRYQLLLDEERAAATASKRKAKQLEADLLQAKKRLQQEMTAGTQKDQKLADLQRKFPTLLSELERTEGRCHQLAQDKEELYQQVQALRRELQQVKEEAHLTRKADSKAKSTLEQSHQRVLGEVFALNTRLTESVLLVSELRSKRERDQETMLREAARQAQLEQSVVALERENKDLKAQLQATAHQAASQGSSNSYDARGEEERRHFQQEIDFLRSQLLLVQQNGARNGFMSSPSLGSPLAASPREMVASPAFGSPGRTTVGNPRPVSELFSDDEEEVEEGGSPAAAEAEEEATAAEELQRQLDEERTKREELEVELRRASASSVELEATTPSPAHSVPQPATPEEEEEPKEILSASALRQHLYRPEKNDTTDVMMAKVIRSKLADGLELLPPNFRRITAGVYQFGTRKIHISLQNNQPVVRVGGGYMIFPAFVKKYGRSECVKTRKMPEYASQTPERPSETQRALRKPNRSPF